MYIIDNMEIIYITFDDAVRFDDAIQIDGSVQLNDSVQFDESAALRALRSERGALRTRRIEPNRRI